MTTKNNTQYNQQKRIIGLTLFALASGFSTAIYATIHFLPDAGTTLRDLAPIRQLPAASSAINLQAPIIDTKKASGGEKVTVQTISFTGNSQYTSEALRVVLGHSACTSYDKAGLKDLTNLINKPNSNPDSDLSAAALRTLLDLSVCKSYDLAGLQNFANLITAHYRNNGFPFAYAFLPVQPITDGALVIKIIEGRYSSVKATGDRATSAQMFLNRLKTGEVIQNASLERATLILSDQPGFKATPVIRPGKTTGTGELDVKVEPNKQRYSGEMGLDNYGNRYTGRILGHLDLNLNSPLLFGDQLKLKTLYSDGKMWTGSFNYNLPLGGSGLRANAGYSSTNYELGKEFASLKVHGTSKVTSAGLSYPITRSQESNLRITATYQYKELNNIDDVTPTNNTNSSDSLPISLEFDQVDGDGITYGSVSWTHGDLTVASANLATDSATAKTAGKFDKLNLDVSHLQSYPDNNFSLFARVSAQWAGNNLDSSEKMGLGGAQSVRAYPSGEAYGDEGIMAQLEARYINDNLAPYVFYDTGSLTTNKTPWPGAGNNKRSLSGAGLGLRYESPNWSVDTNAAWRLTGTPSDSAQADTPVVWIGAKYKF